MTIDDKYRVQSQNPGGSVWFARGRGAGQPGCAWGMLAPGLCRLWSCCCPGPAPATEPERAGPWPRGARGCCGAGRGHETELCLRPTVPWGPEAKKSGWRWEGYVEVEAFQVLAASCCHALVGASCWPRQQVSSATASAEIRDGRTWVQLRVSLKKPDDCCTRHLS